MKISYRQIKTRFQKKYILSKEQDDYINDNIFEEKLTPKEVRKTSFKNLSYDESRRVYMKKKRDYFGYSNNNSTSHLIEFLE